MKTLNDPFIAYECVNAIGNSLNLDEMLTEVLETFVRCAKAEGGKYLEKNIHNTALVHSGKEFSPSESFEYETDSFSIHETKEEKILNIPVKQGHFLFLFTPKSDIDAFATLFSAFRIKLSNAIDACLSVEKLCSSNLSLSQQIDKEKNRNHATEKLMISQSRLAIMGEMIGMIAHQWRQPITLIGMLTNNTLLDVQLGDIKEKQLISDLQLIDKQIHFLSRTIDDFRNFFRPNKLPKTVTFGEIGTELTTIMGKSFLNRRISLIFEGEDETPFITYKNELLQVFINILNNAKDAFADQHTEHPVIRFQLGESKSSFLFFISDNGGGIPQTIITRIFEPYFSTKSEKNGTGLGLYMSAIIVERHLKGSIIACSDEKGTTFVIKIPKDGHTKGYDVY